MERISKVDQLGWIMGLVGTGIGAGILFLPIQAGAFGVICFVISCLISFVLSYVSHKGFAKLIIDTVKPKDYLQVIKSYLGETTSIITALFFFFLMISNLSVYVIGLKTCISELFFVEKNFFNSFMLSLAIIPCLAIIISLQTRVITRILSLLTFPIIIFILILSLSLMTNWDFHNICKIPDKINFSSGILNNIPVLIFACLFFPSITAMVLNFKESMKSKTNVQFYSYKCLKYAQFILLGFVFFFTLSCLLAIPGEVLKTASGSNLNIVSLIKQIYSNNLFLNIAPVIALLGLTCSFLGYYLGTKESANNIIFYYYSFKNNNTEDEIYTVIQSNKVSIMLNIIICIYLFIISIAEVNIKQLLNYACVPIIAFLLYLIPFFVFTYKKRNKRIGALSYCVLLFGGAVLIAAPWMNKLISIKYFI